MIAGKNQRTIVVSRIVEAGEVISLSPSLVLQGEVGIEGPHSLLTMCAPVVNFQTTENKLVAVYPSRDEDA